MSLVGRCCHCDTLECDIVGGFDSIDITTTASRPYYPIAWEKRLNVLTLIEGLRTLFIGASYDGFIDPQGDAFELPPVSMALSFLETGRTIVCCTFAPWLTTFEANRINTFFNDVGGTARVTRGLFSFAGHAISNLSAGDIVDDAPNLFVNNPGQIVPHDATVAYKIPDDAPSPANGRTVVSVESIANGRLVVVSDLAVLTPIDWDGAGMPDTQALQDAADNEQFIDNIISTSGCTSSFTT